MIDEKLELGTKIYYVQETNLAFQRKKIFMTDDSGVEWYRYDKPLRTHNMKEHTIVGRVLARGEGRVPSIENYYDMYFTEDGVQVDQYEIDEYGDFILINLYSIFGEEDGVQVDQYEIDEYGDSSGYFLDKDEALTWLAKRKEEGEQLERS